VLTRFQADRVAAGKTQGLVLGPYVLSDALGAGSMGTVHKAVSKNDNKHYAVKVLPRRSMWNVRLARRQVRTFGQFSHPTVVPFTDVGTSGGLHYLVWNFVEGEPLETVIQRHSKLDPATTAFVGLHIATGLGLAHQHTLFHGLIKPSNIMVGPGGQISILDFGIGSLLAENEGESLVDTMSTANTLTSGLDCTSPESIMEPTNRTPAGDQYSLGCVLYFCLAGRYPFPEGSAVEKMMAHQFKQPTPIKELAPDASPELIRVIEKLMQKKPEDRFPGIDEVVEALNGIAPPTAPQVLLGTQSLTQTPIGGSTKTGMRGLGLSSHGMPQPLPGAPMAMPTGGADIAARRSMRGEFTPGAPPPAANPRASMGSIQLPPRASMGPTQLNPRASMAPPPPAANPRASMGSIQLPPRASMGPAAAGPRPPAMPAGPAPRASMRAAGPAPRPPVTASVVNLQLPMPNDLYQMDPAAGPPGYIAPSDDEPKPSMGPLGFIAIGAAVAIACFLVVHNLLR
jgi:serine/threonine-protein kinase